MDRSGPRLILTMILLIAYCAGPFIVAIFAIRAIIIFPGGLEEDENLLGILREISGNPGVYLNTIHQMILPVVAAITAATFTSPRLSGISAWLFILPLATILVCLFNAVIFNINPPPEGEPVIAQLFINTAGTLSVYVMMFVGLQLKESQP